MDELDLEVRRGEFLSLLGPSGCGKTTTLRLIAGFERPDEGTVLIGGADVGSLPPYKRDVNTVFQSYALFPHLSVLDNVAYGLKQISVGKGARQAKARELLGLVRLEQVESRKPKQLSGGQQQRVALARALAKGPRGPAPRRAARSARPQAAQGDAGLPEALALGARADLRLRDARPGRGAGHVRPRRGHEQGAHRAARAPREIYDSPATPFVADFIGETNFIRRNGSTIAVRPEQVRVARTGDGLAGEVVAAMVIGPTNQSVIKTDDGQEVLVRQQRSGTNGESDALREGERVFLTWDESSALSLDPHEKEETAHA